VPVDPIIAQFLAQIEGAPKLYELSVPQARQAFEALRIPHPPLALAEVRELEIPGPAGPLRARLYRPTAEGPLPAVVYFHGGGWVVGSLDSHDEVCRLLSKLSGCALVSVDYRLAPEAPFPEPVEDAYAATCWIAEHAEDLQLDATRLGVAGDSAGGNLAAVVSLLARERTGPALGFQALIYPVVQFDFSRVSYQQNGKGYLLEVETMEWFRELYLPEPAHRTDPRAAPLRAPDLRGLPPALVLTAEFDPLRDEGDDYADRLREAGVEVIHRKCPGMIHGFVALAEVVPAAREALTDVARALGVALGAPRPADPA